MCFQELNKKAKIDGELRVPPSKSYGQRAIAMATLSTFSTKINNIGKSKDEAAALAIAQSLGVKIVKKKEYIFIQNGISPNNQNKDIVVNAAESGLSTRLFSCFSLLFNNSFKVVGQGSLCGRTMDRLIDGLQQFGKEIKSKQKKVPLTISGSISNYHIKVDGRGGSQFLTGLLIVAPFLPQETIIEVDNLRSKPYVEMTLEIVADFGLAYSVNKSYNHFTIPGKQKIQNEVEYTVEGDWSSASYFIVAAAIGGKVRLTGLQKASKQADKALLRALQDFGAKITWDSENLIIEEGEKKPIVFDATDCPDLFPALMVLTAFGKGKSKIKGVQRLKNKESNRAISLQVEGKKAGVQIDIEEDEMIIFGKQGRKIEKKITFNSHNDHRIAMAMSLFSINSSHKIIIENANCVEKSYPSFFEDFALI